MKRLLTHVALLFAAIFWGSSVYAQVGIYSFAASSGTYTPIAGTPATLVATTTDPATDEGLANGLPIGFSFAFGGITYTHVHASTNGWITLGTSATNNIPTAAGVTNNLSAGTSARPIIAPLWDDLEVAGGISYTTTGVSPNRVMTIQWSGVEWDFTATGTVIEFQAMLYEGTNVVQFVYNQGPAAVVTGSASIGIAGLTTGTTNRSFLALNGSGTAPTASSTTNTTNISAKPATGQIYTFTPPPPCTGPTTQPTALTITPSVTSAAVSFTAASGGATNYLVVRTPNVTLNATPSNGATYPVGYAIGNGTVVYAGTGTSFTETGLTSATAYTYTIFPFDTSSTCGAGYNTNSPLTGSFTTNTPAAYTWTPTSGAADYRVASNWTPARTTPDITDTLYFTNGGTPQVDSVITQTVAKVAVSNSTSVTLTAVSTAAATLSIRRELGVLAGSTLTLGGANALSMNFVSGASPTASIDGTLNLGGTGTTTKGYSATNSVTTVTGAINVTSDGGTVTGGTTALLFNGTSVYNHARNGGTIPTATYATTSLVRVTGTVGTVSTPPSTIGGNVEYNSPSQTASAASWSSTLSSIGGTFTMVSTGTGSFQFGAAPTLTITGLTSVTGGTLLGAGGTLTMNGGLAISGGTFQGTSATTVNVNGAFTQSGGTITSSTTAASLTLNVTGAFNQTAGTISQTSTGSLVINFTGTAQQGVTLNGTSTTGIINYRINNGINNGIALTGTLNINSGASLTISTGGVGIVGGTVNYNQTTSSLVYNASAAQTINATEFPATNGPTTLTINNSAGVTLPFARTVATLTLTSGRLFTSGGNSITITGGSATGSATAYVVGSLTYRVNSATNVNRTWPIGDAAIYRPVTLNNFNTAGVSQDITASVISGPSGTTPGLTLNPTRYFRISNLSTLTLGATSTVVLSYGSDDVVGPIATAVVVQGPTANGTYTSIGQSANTTSTITSATAAPGPVTAAGGEFFTIANTSAAITTKFWDGGAGTSNWGDAANWSGDVLPSCTDSTVITVGGPQVITLASASNAQTLTVGNGVTLSAPAGTALSVGCATPQGGNKTLTFLGGSILNLTGGTVNVYGPAVFNSGSTFNQSGGLLLLDGNENAIPTTASVTSGSLLQFVSGSNINATAGTIRIVDPLPITNTGGYVISASVPTTATTYFTGTHVIELGDGVSTTIGNTNGFHVYNFPGAGYAPFNNVVVNGGSAFGRWLGTTGSNVVNGNLTINAGSSARTTSTLFVGGTLTNNGMLSNTSTLGMGAISTTYTSTANASFGGSGTYRNTIPTVTITAGGTGYAVGDVLTLTGGTFTTPATFVVTAVSSGAVSTAIISDMGSYTVAPTGANATTTTGAGTGATLTLATGAATSLIPSANMTSLTIRTTAPGTGTLNVPLSMSSTLTMAAGLLNTTSTNLLSLIAGASVSSASNTSFVTGPISKAGTTAFTFPVGKAGTGYQPIAISAPATAATFRAEYIRSNASALGPITATGIVKVSECEYWNLDRTAGTASADVTLNWNANSPCGPNGQAGYITTVADIRAVHFNGTSWDAAGGTPTGTATTGSVTWTGVSVFSPFTLGSVSNANPLPLELTSISAANEGSYNRVTWESAQEKAGLRYELQRSADGRSFTTIEVREGSGEGTSYLHYDNKPLAGMNHYRVRAVEVSGAVTISKTVTAYVTSDKAFALQAFPNPVGDVLTIIASGRVEGTASVMLTDATGKVLRTQIVDNAQTMIDMRGLPAGFYLVRYTDGARTETVKVTKQ